MAGPAVKRRPAKRRVNMRRTLGPHVCSWMERNLVHGPGDVQGEQLHLDAEQVRFIFDAYVIDENGRRLVNRAVYSRPKGRAKSEIAGAIACVEALGPVRFAGWDRKGYPLARGVQYPFARICATEEGQSGNTYDNVQYMLSEGPLREVKGLDVGLTRTFIPGGGEIVPSTASAASKDGGKETFAVFDETHLYVPSRPELGQMHKTVTRNLAKRKAAQPWAMDTTTMYEPGLETVAELAHLYALKLAEAGASDPSFLFDHREAPPITDWDDDDELRAALTYVYGEAAGWTDIERMIVDLRKPDARRIDFQRYFLNQRAGDGDLAFVDMAAWDRMAVNESPDDFIPAQSRVCLGLDGSRAHDQAVVSHATPPNADGVIRADLVVHDANRGRLPDQPFPHVVCSGKIDYDDFSDGLTERFQRYRVREAAYGQDFVHDATRVIDRRIPESRIAQVPRGSKLERAALGALDTVLQSGKFEHRGDPVLRRQMANTLVVRDQDTRTIIRIKPRKPSEPIHAVRALAMAVWRASRLRSSSVYQDRGLAVLEPSQGGVRDVSESEMSDAREAYRIRILGDDDDD